MGLPPWMAGYICPNATCSTGLHGTSSRGYHTHISNTKLLFIDLVGNSDLTLHANYKFGSISETMNGFILTATLAPPSLLLSLLKTCQEYIDKQCRHKRDAAEITYNLTYNITDSHNWSNNKQKVNNNRTTALERTAA